MPSYQGTPGGSMVKYHIRFAVKGKESNWTRYYDKDMPYVDVVAKIQQVLIAEFGSTYILLSTTAQPTQEPQT